MTLERPDLSQVPPAVRAYIEKLEDELDRMRGRRSESRRSSRDDEIAHGAELPQAPPLPAEPPTTLNVITMSAFGIAKRTPRHLYSRQRRGGMGIFDLDTPEADPPAILVVADENQNLLLFTSLARAFRMPVNQIVEAPVRSRGQSITAKMGLQPGERLVAALPDEARGAVALVSEHGIVRHLRHHVFGEYLKPGTTMFDVIRFGVLAAACRTPGDGDLFIATRQGRAIRFSERLVPPQGGPGIRPEKGDVVVAVAAVNQDSQVFMVDAAGRGTLRLMTGFNPNKSAGGGGKIAMNTDSLVSAVTVDTITNKTGDIFMISRLSKIIRFLAEEVPAKEGVVQGVDCMALRSDEVAAIAMSIG